MSGDPMADLAARMVDLHRYIDELEAQVATQNLDGYFIAPDYRGEPWIWREGGDYPQLVLAKWALRDDPAVWDVLAAAIKEKP